MKRPTLVNGHEILDLVSKHPFGIRLGRLHELVAERFGPSVSFHTGCQAGLDLDELMLYFESHDRIEVFGGRVTAPQLLERAS
jgi:probable metal-binding protein